MENVISISYCTFALTAFLFHAISCNHGQNGPFVALGCIEGRCAFFNFDMYAMWRWRKRVEVSLCLSIYLSLSLSLYLSLSLSLSVFLCLFSLCLSPLLSFFSFWFGLLLFFLFSFVHSLISSISLTHFPSTSFSISHLLSFFSLVFSYHSKHKATIYKTHRNDPLNTYYMVNSVCFRPGQVSLKGGNNKIEK